jgi:hypothetical protein
VAARLSHSAAAAAAAARAAGPSGRFVLLSTASYLLPLMEARRRRSPFWAFLFLSLLALTFLTHCEDMGLCAPLADATLARLHSLTRGVTYYTLLCVELVVFEVRQHEAAARAVCGAWALLVWIVDPAGGAVAANVAASLLLTGALFLFELRASARRIVWPPYLTRLAVIAAIAAGGFALFSLLHRFWLWHGVWHVYNAGACFVLLLAQRRKLENSQARRARGGGGEGASAVRRGGGGGGGYGSGGGNGGSTTIDAGLTTPVKRFSDGGGGDGAGSAGAVAPRVASEGSGSSGDGGGSAQQLHGGYPQVQPV